VPERLLPGEPRRIIRLFPDEGRDWPLWEDHTDWRMTGYTMEPADYGLSIELTAALREWNDLWESHFHYARGWDTTANEVDWKQRGELVAARLRDEVKEWADVEYDGRPW
jgi:hypothetical protein